MEPVVFVDNTFELKSMDAVDIFIFNTDLLLLTFDVLLEWWNGSNYIGIGKRKGDQKLVSSYWTNDKNVIHSWIKIIWISCTVGAMQPASQPRWCIWYDKREYNLLPDEKLICLLTAWKISFYKQDFWNERKVLAWGKSVVRRTFSDFQKKRHHWQHCVWDNDAHKWRLFP